MTRGEEDGVPRHRELRLREEGKLKNGMLMCMTVLGLLQGGEATGRKRKVVQMEKLSARGHLKMRETIADRLVDHCHRPYR